jgi:LTXXQ motif family protein
MRIAARCLMVIAMILSTATLSSTGFARGMHGAVRARGGGGVSGNLCGSGSALETSLAILDILIKPNESQKAALDELKKVAKEYSNNMSRVCAVDIPPSVPEKLAASETFLETALAGTRSLKPVAEKFYASLSDDQKAQVDSLVFWPGF